jgi:hypothetical protein
MEALIPLVLSMIEQALPLLAKAGAAAAPPAIAKIINVLVVLAPVIKQTYVELKPRFAAVILALKSDPAANLEQIKTLEDLAVGLDADFDSALADALAEDAAAAAKGTS